MKKLIKSILCLIKGHKWRIIDKRWVERVAFDESHPNGVLYWDKIFKFKCTRCGKTKEEDV